MKLRAPLYSQIILYFLLNLALVGVVLALFIGGPFRFELDSLLTGRAGSRMDSATDVIAAELTESPRQNWDAVLERFSKAYHVQFALFQANGLQIAGKRVDLPPSAMARFRQIAPGGPPGPRGAQGFGPPPAGPGFGEPPLPEPSDRNGEPPPPESRQPPQGQRPDPGRSHPKIMIHTANPARYWVLTPIPIAGPGRPPSEPGMLAAISDSVTGGGLFFEVKQWLIAAFTVLFVSILCWLPLLRGITGAISRLTDATGRIAQGQFDVRVPEGRRDELGSLAQSVNSMAARLDGFVTGQKRFLGDIAHELCAPLARIQVSLGILEQRAGEEGKASLSDLREEIEQMSALVNELLSFSKAALTGAKIALQPVQLLPIINEALHREGTEGTGFNVQVSPELSANADPALLSRALGNLVRNAVRYAGNAGPITIAASREGSRVSLRISDSGPGVSEEALPKLFEPFYRADASRDRVTGGVGLGLAIVKTCVESCGGTVSCQHRTPHGLEVTINLDAAIPLHTSTEQSSLA